MDIQTKDGILLRGIPDGTPDDVIKARINDIRAGKQSQAAVQNAAPQQSSALRLQNANTELSIPEKLASYLPDSWADNGGGKVAGFVQGMADPSVAAGQMIANATGFGDKVNPAIAKQNQQYEQARQQQGRDGVDLMRIGGNVAATLPLMSVPGGQTLGAKVASGAAVGGLSGALQPVTQGDFASEKLKQTTTGASFGGGLGAIGAGLSKVINPSVKPEVKALLKDGVRLTPGQMAGGITQKIEDKLQSVPLVGDMIAKSRSAGVEDLNRAAYARALKGTNIDPKSLPVGQEGIKAVKDAVGKQYDNLLPKLSFVPDQQFTQELANLQTMAKGLGEKETNKYQSVLADALKKTSPNGGMTGETYKIVESKLGDEAKKFTSSTDAYQRELGDALLETQRVFKTNLERSNPQFSSELKQANENYANYVRLRAAGAKAGDQSGGFSPAQLAAAIRSSDKSVGKGNVATGQALMQDLGDKGVSVMGSKVPDSGTATRAMMAGGLGTAAFFEPTVLMGMGLGSLPYTKSGQKIAEALLTKRPVGAKMAANTLQKALPLASSALMPSNQ